MIDYEFDRTKVELLQDIREVVNTIDTEVDWFLIYFTEKNEYKKKIYYTVHKSKVEKLKSVAMKMTKKYE